MDDATDNVLSAQLKMQWGHYVCLDEIHLGATENDELRLKSETEMVSETAMRESASQRKLASLIHLVYFGIQ